MFIDIEVCIEFLGHKDNISNIYYHNIYVNLIYEYLFMCFDCVLYSLTGLFTINGVQNKEALSTPGGYNNQLTEPVIFT